MESQAVFQAKIQAKIFLLNWVPEESPNHIMVDAGRCRQNWFEALLGRVALAAVGDEDAVEGLLVRVRQLVNSHLVYPHLNL